MKKAVFLLCFALSAALAAGQPIDWDGRREVQTIGGQVEFLEDPGGRLTIGQVSEPPWAGRFTRSDKPILNFGFTESVYWLKFSV
ncbi:MAG: hypothetical protein H7Z72_20595, partial [Bacteroidetes bacterium]|nr:hypothetical protein [Fibrella sp.]